MEEEGDAGPQRRNVDAVGLCMDQWRGREGERVRKRWRKGKIGIASPVIDREFASTVGGNP